VRNFFKQDREARGGLDVLACPAREPEDIDAREQTVRLQALLRRARGDLFSQILAANAPVRVISSSKPWGSATAFSAPVNWVRRGNPVTIDAMIDYEARVPPLIGRIA
jgi:hypothetical protein